MIQSAGEEQEPGPTSARPLLLVPYKSVLNLYPHFHTHFARTLPPAMPQNGHSPSSTTSKTGSDDSSSHMVDQTDRKKKNADAQAAFRARRANYIATLEETGSSSTSVCTLLNFH